MLIAAEYYQVCLFGHDIKDDPEMLEWLKKNLNPVADIIIVNDDGLGEYYIFYVPSPIFAEFVEKFEICDSKGVLLDVSTTFEALLAKKKRLVRTETETQTELDIASSLNS